MKENVNRIFLVKYKEQNIIESYIETKEDFKKWLVKHNKRRKEEGELLENEGEFKLIEINKLEVEKWK